MDNKTPLEMRELSAEKRELLALLLEEEGIASSPVPTIVPRAHTDALPPLSFAQQRMWLLHQLEPTSAAYNEPEAVRITGPLNVVALEHSLNELVRRHDILRTVFPTVAGEPVQVIRDTLHLSMPVVELQPGTAAEQDNKLRPRALAVVKELFDSPICRLFCQNLLRLS